MTASPRNGVYRYRQASGLTFYAFFADGRLIEVWPRAGQKGPPQKRASVKRVADSIGHVREMIERERMQREMDLIELLAKRTS